MRLLLDTHIIVWAASGVGALEPRVATLLTDTRHELWISAVSTWELAMLAERGRLELRPDPERWIEAAVGGWGDSVPGDSMRQFSTLASHNESMVHVLVYFVYA